MSVFFILGLCVIIALFVRYGSVWSDENKINFIHILQHHSLWLLTGFLSTK